MREEHLPGLSIRPPEAGDSVALSTAFSAIGWSKPVSLFEQYLVEQQQGSRWMRVAVWESSVAGYVTVVWESEDPALRDLRIPEIVDLNVLPDFRRRGIGRLLLSHAEAEAQIRSDRVGIRVGLHSGYGAAQRLYVTSGYVPDGSGALRSGTPVPEDAAVPLDDDTTLRLVKVLGS